MKAWHLQDRKNDQNLSLIIRQETLYKRRKVSRNSERERKGAELRLQGGRGIVPFDAPN